ncbi:class II glutamine amidotransferase, partial [Streptomyces fradiae]
NGDELRQVVVDFAYQLLRHANDSLWYLAGPGRPTVVASEPYDDDPGWREVPDRTLLTATADGVTTSPLAPLTAPAGPARSTEPAEPYEESPA